MANNQSTPPGTNPPVTQNQTALPGAGDLQDNYEKIKELESAYKDFADVLENRGTKQAVEYVRTLNDVTKGVLKNSDVINGMSDAIKRNAQEYGSALHSIEQGLMEQARTVSRIQSELSSKNEDKQKHFKQLVEGMSGATTEQKVALDWIIKNTKLLADEKKKLADLQKELTIEQAKQIAYFTPEYTAREAKVKLLTREKEAVEANVTSLEQQKTQNKNLIDSNVALKKAAETFTSATDEETKSIIKLAVQLGVATAKIKEYSDAAPILRAGKIINENNSKVSDGLTGLIDKLSGASSRTNMFASSVISMGGGFKNFSETLKSGIISSLFDVEKSLSRLGDFFYKFAIEPAFKFDKTIAEVNRTTGGFGKEFEQIATKTRAGGLVSESATANLSQYGVTLEKLGKTYGVLSNSISGFNNLSDDQRKLFAANAASLETLGLSADTYSKLVSRFMGSIGTNAVEADSMVNKLAKDAIGAGENVGKYAASFESLMPRLAAYAKDATEAFRELNALSRATMGTLKEGDFMALSDQFNTIEGATETLSKFNAVLGGTSANFIDLMNADPTERIIKLKTVLEQSNVTWDQLNPGYRRMFAELFGGDVSKAEAFYKMSSQKMREQMNMAAADDKEKQERMARSVDAQEKLNAAIENMKIALTPVLTMFNGMANGLIGMQKALSPTGAIAIGFISLAGIATAAFNAFFTIIKVQLAGLTIQLKTAQGELIATMGLAGTAGGIGGFKGLVSTMSPVGKIALGVGALAGIIGIASAVKGVDSESESPISNTSAQAVYTSKDGSSRTPDSKYIMMNGTRINLDKDDHVLAAKDQEIPGFSRMLNGKGSEGDDNKGSSISWFQTFTKTISDVFEKSYTLVTEKAIAAVSTFSDSKTSSQKLTAVLQEKNDKLRTTDKDHRNASSSNLVKELATVHHQSMVTFVKEQQKTPQQLYATLNINGLTIGEGEQQKIVTSAVSRTMDGLNQKVTV